MQERTHEMIVIGGGFAGIAASRELSQAGHEVLILEARDRLGGRTWYKHVDELGQSLELGGTWVHWTQPCVFAEVLRYGLELKESLGAARPEVFIFRTGEELRTMAFEDGFPLLDSAIQRFCHDIAEVLPEPYQPLKSAAVNDIDQLSVQQRLDELHLSSQDRDLLSGMWGVASSARCESSGLLTILRWYALSCNHTDTMFDAIARYKIKTGTRSLIDAMAADAAADIRLSTPVSCVEQVPGGVRVETRTGDVFGAEAAIVTAPLNTLRAIDFRPGLSEAKEAVIAEGQASRGLKAWVRVQGDLPDALMALSPDTEALQYAHTEEILPDGQLLVTFGCDADALDVNSVDDMDGAVRRLLGDDTKVVATTGTNWLADEFSRGTWPILRPRQATRYLRELQTPEGRVYFAGSETANGWNGFIDGAIESGVRASRQLLQATRRAREAEARTPAPA
jgi:monoamine oxidase